MRAYLSLPLCVLPFLMVGCNTPPIPPGKPVDIPTALEQILDGLCDAQKNLAGRQKDLGVAVDTISVELDLTVDGTKNPPIAVAPDIQFIPTVSYGQIITATKGSRLTLSFRNTGNNAGIGCHGSKPAN
ncbi:hypothetical protein [Paraburkholderia rhizosphaerae]|uniref:Uncharacterized protein n=1 Tax=Paraburkholderia rhizosphaerae TaxID=480658 RepID=A0A4R8LIK0_9BURK|nr:hypothetical protein [Paraburkholderia rhizosphaerae]TDY43253.1 hypothetical protein BX592_11848 [Paraburkholderia rhizosphaerae]